jgi:hypothetical protein
MRRLLVLATAIVTLLSFPGTAEAAAPTVHGGGTGTFDADLDADGDVDGSSFGFTVSVTGGGNARGHFMCLMAGRSDILGLPIMSVTGRVTGGSVGAGTVTFSGTATVNLGNGVLFRGVPFQVQVWPGGPGVGVLQLSVIGAFDGVPGDTAPGNGNYDLPVEYVRSGAISMS